MGICNNSKKCRRRQPYNKRGRVHINQTPLTHRNYYEGGFGVLFGLPGGLGGFGEVGMGGVSERSGGPSSLVIVARRMALRSRLMTAGCVLGGAPWKLLRLCADSMRVSMAAEVKSLLASKLGRTRSMDMRDRSKLGRMRQSDDMRGAVGGMPSVERRYVKSVLPLPF